MYLNSFIGWIPDIVRHFIFCYFLLYAYHVFDLIKVVFDKHFVDVLFEVVLFNILSFS
jgi:hypothetical protein